MVGITIALDSAFPLTAIHLEGSQQYPAVMSGTISAKEFLWPYMQLGYCADRSQTLQWVFLNKHSYTYYCIR